MTRLEEANYIIICPLSECNGRMLFVGKDQMAVGQLFNAHIKLKHDNNSEVWSACTIIKGKVLQNFMCKINNKYKDMHYKSSVGQ
jgi:hypothetical protein